MATSMADLGFNIDSSPMRRTTTELDRMSRGAGRAERSAVGLSGAYKAVAGALASIGAASFVRELVRVNSEAQRLQASLKTVTGSLESASAAWADLEQFARTTPFALTQSIQAFTKMKALGLDPTIAALTSFGNTAAAMGKDLNQMIEAVADAATGEFERLKEFGIRAKQQGDQVTFIFQGVEKTVAKNAASITEYLQGIGEVQFAGAMSDQMDTIGGQLSNLEDSADSFFRALGGAGGNSGISAAISGVASAVNSLTDNVETLAKVGGAALLVVAARFSGPIVSSILAATAAHTQYAAQLARGNVVTLGSAKADAQKAQAASASAASDLVAARASAQRAAAEVASMQAVVNSVRTEIQLEQVRLKAQITDEGRRLTINRMAAARIQLSAATAALTKVEAQHTAALAGVTAAENVAATATTRMTAALSASTVAARAATGAMAGLRGAMAFLGGPVGVALIAAGSLYYFRDSLFDTRQEATETEKSIKSLTERMQGLTRAQLQHERSNIARQMRENASALVDAQAEVQRLQKMQSDSAARSMSGIGSVKVLAEMGEAMQRAGALSRESEALSEALKQVDQQMADLGTSAANTNEQLDADRVAKLAEAFGKVRDQLDPLGAEFATVNRQIETVMGAASAGIIDNETRDRMIKQLVEGMAEAGEDAADEFVNPWQSAADRVADSLQDAIASGDWDKLGDAIGNALAASISGIVNKTITDSLAQNLTASSGTLAAIGGAFAGPIAGAVAGGAIQLAVSELSDFFSGSDWDPTESRQAAQGTGTVLGSIDAKSESIAKATDLAATASRELVGINRNMLRALQAVQLGIGGASARVARGAGGIGFDAPGVRSNMFDVGGAVGGLLDKVPGANFAVDNAFSAGFNMLTLGFGNTIGKLLGGKSRQVDEGVQIIGGYIGDLIDETMVNTYATFRVKKNVFSSTKTKERFQRIGGDVEQQFALVFESLFDSVVAGADILGVDAASRLASFRVGTQRLSLEGLSAAQQTAELEAYFGTVFDNMAQHTIPWLEDFQMAGEGLGETLARVATDVAVTEQAVDMLGLRFSSLAGRELVEASQRLVEVNGGMEQFISGMQNFISNFATEAQQFEINATALASGMGDLPLPETREGFWQLLQAQDAATSAGAENIATLLRLQGTANEYYSAVEKAQKSYYETEIQGQRARLNEAVKAQSAVESALGRMVLDSRSVQQASRTNALEALRRAASSGRVTASDALDRNLSAATAMQASDYATFGEYIQDYTRTTSTLLDLKEITDRQVTTEERMLSSLERQLEAVTGLRQDLERSQLAIIKQTQKSAKSLERIEGETEGAGL